MGFYDKIAKDQKYDDKLEKCISNVVYKLEEITTSTKNPGVLLGKIQSGKTRGFLGIIAKSFDDGYDIALVLTKGTKTLAKQTVSRISKDFKEFVDEELFISDIMDMPERLTRAEVNKKIIIVAKKEVKNLERVITFFNNENYPELKKKKVILIDDEADMGSVRFVKKKLNKTVEVDEDETQETGLEQGKIAQKMDYLRNLIEKLKFLQVTATPYSLYLQPENYPNPFLFLPKKPAFTELLPIHDKYVGGDDYFGHFESDDPRKYLYVEVPEDEQAILRSNIDMEFIPGNILNLAGISSIKKAVVSFLISVSIRRWQQRSSENKQQKYAMIIHNDTQRKAHAKQWSIVEALRVALEDEVVKYDSGILPLFDSCYEDITRTVGLNKGVFPDKNDAYDLFKEIIIKGEINVQRVNSDVELSPLLDPATAELRLRTEANIFIGGSLLDRGITIPNLISFYYGRNPKRMQADTVLQHSRMYGARDREDLAVTRFYTSKAVFNRLKHVHEFDSALRKAFVNNSTESGVVFIESDSAKGVIPCAPSKVSVSRVITIDAGSYYLPTGFGISTKNKTPLIIKNIDMELSEFNNAKKGFQLIKKSKALAILDQINKTIVLDKNEDFYWEAMYGLIDYYCKATGNDTINVIVEKGRQLNKDRSGDKSGRSIVGGEEIRNLLSEVREQPALVLLRQEGGIKRGWDVDSAFWWPILISPTTSGPCVYSMP